MWPSLFDDPETKASFERLRGRYDQRMAFMVAATDGAFRARVKKGCTPLEAYALSTGELAKINATLEGLPPDIVSVREKEAYEKTLREGVDHPERPHEERLFRSP